jgi:hypothetical protein
MPGFPTQIVGTATNRGKAGRNSGKRREVALKRDPTRAHRQHRQHGQDRQKAKMPGFPTKANAVGVNASRRDRRKPAESPALHKERKEWLCREG